VVNEKKKRSTPAYPLSESLDIGLRELLALLEDADPLVNLSKIVRHYRSKLSPKTGPRRRKIRGKRRKRSPGGELREGYSRTTIERRKEGRKEG